MARLARYDQVFLSDNEEVVYWHLENGAIIEIKLLEKEEVECLSKMKKTKPAKAMVPPVE